MGLLEKLMKRMAGYYAREHGGIGWGWQDGLKSLCGSFGRPENGQESHGYRPSDRAHLTNGLDFPGLALAQP